MKVGITGSQDFYDSEKIKKVIYKLKHQYGNDLIISTRGDVFGPEKYAKKISKWIFNVKYVEFPPYFKPWNEDCANNGIKEFRYNKQYLPKYYPIRDNQFIKYCDIFILFLDEDDLKLMIPFIDRLKKKNKKYITTF